MWVLSHFRCLVCIVRSLNSELRIKILVPCKKIVLVCAMCKCSFSFPHRNLPSFLFFSVDFNELFFFLLLRSLVSLWLPLIVIFIILLLSLTHSPWLKIIFIIFFTQQTAGNRCTFVTCCKSSLCIVCLSFELKTKKIPSKTFFLLSLSLTLLRNEIHKIKKGDDKKKFI
jgi:hypothetical protein